MDYWGWIFLLSWTYCSLFEVLYFYCTMNFKKRNVSLDAAFRCHIEGDDECTKDFENCWNGNLALTCLRYCKNFEGEVWVLLLWREYCSCGSSKGKKWILKRGLGVGWNFLLMTNLGPCFSFLVQFHGQTRYGVLFILLVQGSSYRWDWDVL